MLKFTNQHFNPRRPKVPTKTGATPSCFFWITFLRVKQNQQDFTYSYLDKQQIEKKGVKFQIRSGNTGRERCKHEGKVGE